MTETNALTIYNQFDQLQRAALALHASKYFGDVKNEAQAIVKVMAGAELGLPPFASMTGIHIIQGKPVLGANVLATLVKNDPRYDFHIKTADDKACVLTWLENGEIVGETGFTIAEAKNAGLVTKDNWKKYPSDMLFARAISRGARRFAPGIFGGSPIYTPDEMGAEVDEEGAVIIEAKLRDVTNEVNTEPVNIAGPGDNGRPFPPEVVKEKLQAAYKKYTDKGWEPQDRGEEKEQSLRGIVIANLENCFAGDKNSTEKRHTVTFELWGKESTNDLDLIELVVTKRWLDAKPDDGGEWHANHNSAFEAKDLYKAALKAEGQKEMEL